MYMPKKIIKPFNISNADFYYIKNKIMRSI